MKGKKNGRKGGKKESMSTLKVGKLEAAQRQIDCAIELWFHDGDPISIHTLAGASEVLLIDLAKHAGIAIHTTEEAVDPQHRAFMRRMIRTPRNFFKHADSDPTATLEIEDEVNRFMLWGLVQNYPLLSKGTSLNMIVFAKHFEIHNPQFFATRDIPQSPDIIELKRLGKREFFEDMRAAFIAQGA